MPTYVFQCPFCLGRQEHVRSIAERDANPPLCHNREMQRIIVSPSMVTADIEPYRSMVDGSMIMGRAEHREHLKRHHLIEVGDQQHHLKPYGNYKPQGVKESLIESMHRVKERHR